MTGPETGTGGLGEAAWLWQVPPAFGAGGDRRAFSPKVSLYAAADE